MSRDSDDDALRWVGDDDPTLAPGWKAVGNPAPARGAAVPAEAAEAATATEAESNAATSVEASPSEPSRQTGSVELVVLGVLGGIYLLYAIGWLVVATTAAPVFTDPVAQFMYGLGRWVAVLAPALWFGAVLWLAAGRRRTRLAWLLAGALLLAPIPFLLRG